MITSLCPLDGRYANTPKFDELRSIFSEYGLIKFRLFVEIEWLIYLANLQEIKEVVISKEDIVSLRKWCKEFSIADATKIKEIEKITNHDVKALEYFIQDKFKDMSLAHLNSFIHFACTSEDINNLAYALMLKSGREILLKAGEEVSNTLETLSKDNKEVPMLSRTHGQPATPTTVGKEIYVFVYRLERALRRIKKVELLGKFAGAVGNYNAHLIAYPEVKWDIVNRDFVENLGLVFNPFTTQIESHDFIAELADSFVGFNNILLDLSRDFWLYISMEYFKQRVNHKEVGSSTMPHKVNPIDFENCEGNVQVANSLAIMVSNKLPISRLQRDLSDSTVLRNLGLIFGYSILALNSLLKGLHKVEINKNKLNDDLDANVEVLTEAVQTVMRKHGIDDAYNRLKDFSRGNKLTLEDIRSFIDLQDIPFAEKTKLQALTPCKYIGLADKLF